MLLSLIVLADVDGCSCMPGQSARRSATKNRVSHAVVSPLEATLAFTTKYLDTRSPPSSAQRYNSAGESVCLSSVTFVRPTQAIEIFGNISAALGTLAIL